MNQENGSEHHDTQRRSADAREDADYGETFFMTKLILLLSTLILPISCATHRRSAQDLDRDKAEVFRTSVRFWQAYERKEPRDNVRNAHQIK